MDFKESDDDKICPWDYGSRETSFEDTQSVFDGVNDFGSRETQFEDSQDNQYDDDDDDDDDDNDDESSESSWCESGRQFEIDSSMKRPGGTILRFN